MECDATLECTGKLLDVVNLGDLEKVRYLVENLELIDIDLDVDCLIPYMCVKLPHFSIDLIRQRGNTHPEKVLGCALLQPDVNITQVL